MVESGLVFVRRPLKKATGPVYDGPFPVLAEKKQSDFGEFWPLP
jgi:hypothetical protein